MHRHKKLPIIPLLTLAAILSFLFFIVWLVSVVVPVVVVEAKYQSMKVLTGVFGVTSLRGLIIPSFYIQTDAPHKEGAIVIPGLFLDEPVVYNVDPNDESAYTQALRKGIAHASGTGLPGSGGLGYYFAHSSNPQLARQYNAVFYLLGKLERADGVVLWHDGRRYEYKVTHSMITGASDVSFLEKKYEKETIVLQTCWPPGTAAQRLLVFAEAAPPRE